MDKKGIIIIKKKKRKIIIIKEAENKEFFSKNKLKRSLRVSYRLQLLSKQFIKKGKSKSNFLILNLIEFVKKK
jgi:transcriptional regulator NrdR family protein